MASRMARWLPAAASRPWISTSTRSASCSTSESTWELTITVRPSAPRRRKRSTRCTRCTGSAPLRGSSSTSTGGSVTRAAATLARWRIPLLNPARRRSAAGSMSTESSARSAAPRRRPRRGGRRRSAPAGGRSAGRGRPRPPGTRAMRRWTSRSVRGSRPSTRTRPVFTPIRPVMARMSVLLPAPLGPSSPVTPGPNEQASSDSATFWPNQTDAWSTSTVASATKAGSSAAAARASRLRRPVAAQQRRRRRRPPPRRSRRRPAPRRR